MVWLGEEHDTQPQEALSLFKELDSGSKHIGIFENALKSWHDIFSRPWWTRTRILQEVLHDRPVMAYIGQTQIEFDYLCSKHYCYRIPEVINHQMTEREPGLLLPPHPRAKYNSLFSAAANRSAFVIGFTQKIMKNDPSKYTNLPWCFERFRQQKYSDPRGKSSLSRSTISYFACLASSLPSKYLEQIAHIQYWS